MDTKNTKKLKNESPSPDFVGSPIGVGSQFYFSPRRAPEATSVRRKGREPDIPFLRHACSILRQSSNPVCGSWMSQVSSRWAKQHRATCSDMEKPHAGLDDCLRMLQASFRKMMSEGGLYLLSFCRTDECAPPAWLDNRKRGRADAGNWGRGDRMELGQIESTEKLYYTIALYHYWTILQYCNTVVL